MKLSRTTAAIVTLALALSSLIMSSCTCRPTEQELQSLRDLRAQERDLTTQISKTEKEISGIKSEIGEINKKLDKCNEDKKFVQKHLPNWPNIWPADIQFEEPIKP